MKLTNRFTSSANTGTSKTMVKAIVLGPIIVSLIFAIIYFAWWGLSKLFYQLHGWMTASVIPWVTAAWPYVLGIWAFVLISSIIFVVLGNKAMNKYDEDVQDDVEEVEEAEEAEEAEEDNSATAENVMSYSDSSTKMNFEDFWNANTSK